MTLLTRRALVLAGVEAAYDQEAVLSAAADAVLAQEPDYQVDFTVLERGYATEDLSPKPHAAGRKLARAVFTTELKNDPKVGRLLRGCGYSETTLAAAEAGPVVEHGAHANKVSWAVDDAALTNTEEVTYFLTVTTGGASGAAEIEITSDKTGEESAPQVVTTGMPLTLGTLGLSLTPTFTGELAVGQSWSISISPNGAKWYDPVSTGQESLTLHLYFDGMLHKLTGAYGTFTITAEAGNYATMQWTFTGTYYKPTDVAFPAGAEFGSLIPPMVEEAKLRVDGFAAVVNAYNYDQANTIGPRPDVNSPNGYNGVRITGRNPTGGIDPEASLVAEHDFWDRLANAKTMPLQLRIGKAAGNTVWIKHPQAQYTGLTYRDREGLRTYDAGVGFKRYKGNDETKFIFY